MKREIAKSCGSTLFCANEADSFFNYILGTEILCRVDEDYMLDDFNLKGLSKYVPNVSKVLAYMLKQESTEKDSDEEMGESPSVLHKYALIIYAVLHARYIQTERGMKQMVRFRNTILPIAYQVPERTVRDMSAGFMRESEVAAHWLIRCSADFDIENVLSTMSGCLCSDQTTARIH